MLRFHNVPTVLVIGIVAFILFIIVWNNLLSLTCPKCENSCLPKKKEFGNRPMPSHQSHVQMNTLSTTSKTMVPVSSSKRAGLSFLKKNSDLILSPHYKRIFMRTLMEFVHVWHDEFGFNYMLASGTMLGAYRHGGFIPFDDDVDLMVDMKYRKIFFSVFEGTKLKAVKNQDFRSVYLNDNSTIKNSLIQWPYIDIFFYENATKDGTTLKIHQHAGKIFPRADILPPVPFMFEGRQVFAPRCPYQYLKRLYGANFEKQCCSHTYNHRTTGLRGKKAICIDSTALHGLVPFTRWRQLNSTHRQEEFLKPLPSNANSSSPLSWKQRVILPIPKC